MRHECAVRAVQGAKVQALRCEMDHSRCDAESHGACVKGAGTTLTVTDCDMHDNAGSGAAANFGAQLSVQNCAVSNCRMCALPLSRGFLPPCAPQLSQPELHRSSSILSGLQLAGGLRRCHGWHASHHAASDALLNVSRQQELLEADR